MMKLGIVEDEENVRRGIIKTIELMKVNAQILFEVGSVQEGEREIKTKKIDLLLLDIRLSDGSAFDLLEKVGNDKMKIIFISAYDEYAVRAFKFKAADYILKPFDPHDLKESLEKNYALKCEEDLMRNRAGIKLDEKSQKIAQLVINTTREIHLIDISEIIYLKASGSYCYIYCENKKILASRNLSYFERTLIDHEFIRIHQSYLVNKFHIVCIKGGSINLKNNIELPISFRRVRSVKNELRNSI